MQIELKLAIAVVVGLMKVAPDAAMLKATTPGEFCDLIRTHVTCSIEGGVHLLMTPRAPQAPDLP